MILILVTWTKNGDNDDEDHAEIIEDNELDTNVMFGIVGEGTIVVLYPPPPPPPPKKCSWIVLFMQSYWS